MQKSRATATVRLQSRPTALLLVLVVLLSVMHLAACRQLQRNRTALSMLIFRHGAREALLADAEGPLTETGKLQEYLLGREIASRYKGTLLSKQYTPAELNIQTSPKERAVESAKWFLAGLYPQPLGAAPAAGTGAATTDNSTTSASPLLVGGERLRVNQITADSLPPNHISRTTLFRTPTTIQQTSDAIPDIIFSAKSLDKDLFYHAYTACPDILRRIEEAHLSEQYRELQVKYQSLWTNVVNYFREHQLLDNEASTRADDANALPNLSKLGKYLDFYRANAANGVAEKQKAIEEFPEALVDEMREAKMDYIELKFGSEFVKKAVVSEHFTNMLKLIRKRFYPTCSNCNDAEKAAAAAATTLEGEDPLKMVLYSCHDRNVFLTLFNLCTQQQFRAIGEEGHFQPFASNLNFEFVEVDAAADGSRQFVVYLYYNDHLVHMKCSDEDGGCQLDSFIAMLEGRIDLALLEPCSPAGGVRV